jgi:beta-phosphoglucomutase-like phosphatase (HAD superfamily)
MALRGVVFDFDGVLVDSEPLHFRALRGCLLPEGIAIDEDQYYERYAAYDDRTAIRLALEQHGTPYDASRVDRAAKRKSGLFDELLPGIPFFPGARELVVGLARDLPLAIASGALRSEIERILAAGGLRESFRAVVGAEDVARTKPDPLPYATAVALLARDCPGLRSEECVAFEDTMAGIASARAAGLKVIGVTNTYPAAKLGAAHRVVESLAAVSRADLDALVT